MTGTNRGLPPPLLLPLLVSSSGLGSCCRNSTHDRYSISLIRNYHRASEHAQLIIRSSLRKKKCTRKRRGCWVLTRYLLMNACIGKSATAITLAEGTRSIAASSGCVSTSGCDETNVIQTISLHLMLTRSLNYFPFNWKNGGKITRWQSTIWSCFNCEERVIFKLIKCSDNRKTNKDCLSNDSILQQFRFFLFFFEKY